MSGPVAVQRRDGRLVAVKRAADPAGVERLHREARMLALARIPGVVELVELRDDAEDGVAELVTAYVGSHSLATTRPRSLAQAVALVTAVAGIVEDLHDLGIVHGRLDPTHVLVDDDGRPVLCGLGGAGLVGEPVPGRRRPSGGDEPLTLRPSRDVYALGRLLDLLAGSVSAADTLTLRARRGRGTGSSAPSRALRALVAAATNEDPSCRPAVPAFIESVQALAPGASLAPPRPANATTAADPDHDREPVTDAGATTRADDRPDRAVLERRLPPRPSGRAGLRRSTESADRAVDDAVRPSRRGVTTAAILAAVVATGLGVASTRVGPRPSLDVDAPAPPGASVTSSSATAPRASDAASPAIPDDEPSTNLGSPADDPEALTTPTSPPPPGSQPSTSPAPADGACPSTRTPEAPAVPAPPCTTSSPAPATGVVIAGARYAIGEPGDELLVGDWRCTGSLAVAVVRPTWGDVYLFERLPEGDDEVRAVQVAHLDSGARLETGPAEPDGCPALVGRFPEGSTAVVTVPDALPTPPRPAPEVP